MSGSRPTVGIRISAEGADQARRQIEAIGPAGEAAMRRVAVASAAAAPEMQRLAVASDVAQRAFVGMGGSLGRIGATFTGVSGVAAGLTAGFAALGASAALAAVQIAKAGDTATATLARLSSATGGLAQAQAVYERLFALSQQTGIAVTESAGSFARFAVAAREIGGTNDQVVRLVAGIQKAGIVAGASAQETGAAVQQLGQALASGKLQGDELRSLLENMPQLAQALARELGVGIGQLRQMGTEGKLTADTVFPALLRATEKIGAEFDKMPVTMSRAKDILVAATEDFGARLDRITGLSQTFARFMQQGAAALRGAGAFIAPTDSERVDQAVAAAQERVGRVRAQITADRAASAYGDVSPALRQALEIAESDLREAMARQQEIRRDARELERAEAQDAAAQARAAAQSAATLRLKDTASELDERLKARLKYEETIKKLDEDEGRGGTLPAGVTFASLRKAALDEYTEALRKASGEERKAGDEAAKAAEKRQDVIDKLALQVRAAEDALTATQAGTAASREASIALETENQLRAAGIPDIDKRTEAEKRAAEAIGASVRRLDELKQANREAQEAAKRTRDWHERSWNAVADIGERAFDRLGDAIVQAFVSGQGAAVNFGNIARAVISSAVADFAKLAVVNPLMNSLFTSTAGPRPTLAGAFGGGGVGIGDILGLSGLIPKDGLLGSLGLAGLGSTVLIPGIAQTTSAALGAMGGVYGPASAAQLAATGGSLASGMTLGGLLGGVGLGFGAGSLVNNLLGGNQLGGTIGSGLGAAGGALLGSIIPGIGTLIGGLIGGAAGGGLGGLFGPGESVLGYGFRLQSSGRGPDEAPLNLPGDRLLPIDRTYFNESGRAMFEAADRLVAQTNAYLSQRGLQVQGVSIVGGNKNGADYSWADAGSLEEGFSRLRFSARDNAELSSQLITRTFNDPSGLAAFVEAFTEIQTLVKSLTAEAAPAVSAFSQQLKAINDNFDSATAKARQYGIAETGLTEARARAVAALEAQRAETLRQADVSLGIRRLTAAGNTQEAELARQAEAARQEIDQFGKSLDALGLTAAEKAARLVQLEQVQAAERAAIIARYGEQAAQALRQAGGTIRQYLDSLATGTAAGASPSARLSASRTAFERDLLLSRGGDRDALGRVTASADAYLDAGRDMFASGRGFQNILSAVRSGLGGLPVVQSYDAQQAASLQAIQQAIVNGTLNTQTVILPGGNTVQLAGAVFPQAALDLLAGIANNTANTIATLISAFNQSMSVTLNGLGVVATNVVGGAGAVVAAIGAAQAQAQVYGDIAIAQAANAAIAANDNTAAIGSLASLQAVYGNATLASLGVMASNAVLGNNATLNALGVVATNVVGGAGSVVAAHAVGNTIAANAASAHGVLLSGANTHLAAIAATASALLATETLGVRYMAAVAYNTRLTAGAGGILIAGEPAAPANTGLTYGTTPRNPQPSSLDGVLGGGLTYGSTPRNPQPATLFSDAVQANYTTMALNPGQGDAISTGPDGRGNYYSLLEEMRALSRRMGMVDNTLRQGFTLTAQETRANGEMLAGAIGHQTDDLRREMAA